MAKGGAGGWTQKNEIELQHAVTAVEQAEEDAAKVEAKAGASDADKRQARLRVEEARYKAQQLQNKKDGTSSATTVAPQAALPGRASTSELSRAARSEEHTSEIQSLMRISYAVLRLKKKKQKKNNARTHKQKSKQHTTEI